uniref:Uncharacterized protein n=1 Tax=viral metagenome TaxID=1070528 RepID=A0A6M3KGM1_9ZZZZ
MDIKNMYSWEIELSDDIVITEGNNFDFNKVIRVSYIPKLIILPRHDIILVNFKFKKRFARAFMNFKSIVYEYLHCVVTDKFRFYLFSSSGKTLVTDANYELYL